MCIILPLIVGLLEEGQGCMAIPPGAGKQLVKQGFVSMRIGKQSPPDDTLARGKGTPDRGETGKAQRAKEQASRR